MKLRAALILDDLKIKKWQQEALDAASSKIDLILILNCENTKYKKRYLENFLYYILNFFTLKNKQTKSYSFKFSSGKVINFNSVYKGIWQSIPEDVISELQKNDIDIVLKFGMGLLKIEEKQKKPIFLSFHHGDPSKYRGRPAGFYEIMKREPAVGIIVQQLCNELDAGKVYAFAESQLVNYSYKQTSINFYKNSKYLLHKAIENYEKNFELKIEKKGKIFRLPGNLLVTKFLFLITYNFFKRLIYGFFYEKKWKVALVTKSLSFDSSTILNLKEMKTLPIDPNYVFYADPFFSSDNKLIRLEALDRKTGIGDILEISTNNLFEFKKILTGRHYSYPFSFSFDDKEYLIPEVSDHSSPYIYSLDENFNSNNKISGLEDKRIIDPILYEHDNKWFLFFGEKNTSNNILNLWISDSPFGNFLPHPKTPITISPRFARMGGNILKTKDRLIRFGQNNSRNYGDSLSILQITKLSDKDYEEKEIGKISINDTKGPHSFNVNSNSNQALIDYYQNEFSFFSGLRRFLAFTKKNI